MTAFPSADIKQAYSQGSAAQNRMMSDLRDLVFKTHQGLSGVGEIEEALKWNQPAFTTVKPKSGSPFRVAPIKKCDDKIGLYFICTTTLIQDFRERYSDELTFEGNRAIILDCTEPLPREPLAHCMAMALMYNMR